MLIFPLIFEIILINKLVMKYVDSGSMAYLLATPNSRKKIILTQLLSIVLSITLLIIIITIIGILCSEIMFKGELDIPKYIQLNVSIWLLHLALSSISFFFACFFNESKGFFALGAGLPVIFYLINMLANMGGDLEKLKYFTIFTLVPGKEIIANSSYVLPYNLILATIAIVLYIFGVIRFIKKDLPNTLYKKRFTFIIYINTPYINNLLSREYLLLIQYLKLNYIIKIKTYYKYHTIFK